MIAGIVNWNQESEASADLSRMHREIEPMPVGAWNSCQQPGLAMAASAEEGISALAQQAACTAVFDGVIFNRDEIIQSLGQDAEISTSNADLLLAGYRCWGRDVLDHLIGDFAFAVWDSSAGTLFAAVDPFGLRPCYFAVGNGRVAFGSRMSQLRFLPWVGKDLNDRMIVSFLLDTFKDPTATFYASIRQIPGGHLLWADGKQATITRYWRPGIRNVCRATRPAEVLEEFRDRFRLAVRQRLDARQPTGILMSGGLDSTAIAGIVAEIQKRDPQCVPKVEIISALFGDLPCDESAYIDATLRRLPFANRKIDGRNGAYTMSDLHADMRRHEWPVLHRQGPLFNGFREAARKCGAQILLNGLGGDELTTDYRYYTVPMNGVNPLGILRAARLVREVEKMPYGKALYLLAREACPELIKRPYRWARQRVRADLTPEWSSWLAPEFRRIASDLESPEEDSVHGFDSETLELAWRIVTSPRASWANRFLVDEFAAAGIQCRFPFLDRRLFDLAFSIPPHLRPRCRGGPWFKPYIAHGLADFIPSEIRLRDAKVDFESYNCYVFSRCLEFLRPYLFDGVPWKSEAYVPRSQAVALFQTVFEEDAGRGKQGHAVRKRMETLRNITGLELWLRELNR
jgi:asparagine synthase (glutamine-hydrolysing)